jgi:DHA1 family bicyclomycin/chloramphenicol resistance-like MFS transporter
MAIPVVAPNIGQIVLLFGNWREIFIFIAAFGTLVTLWAYFRLPETQHPEDRLPLTAKRVTDAFRIVLTNRRAFAYTMSTALIFGVLFAFINQAEQIYAHVYDLGPAFTLYFSAGAIFMAVASFSNSKLVERFGMRRLSHGALCLFIVFSAINLGVAFAYGGVPPFAVFLPLTILTFCMFGFIGTNFNALAMDPLGHVAGTASSVLGFMQTFGGGILGAAIGYFYDGTVVPLLLGYVALSVGSLGCVLVAERGQLFGRERKVKPLPAEALVGASPAE